MQRTKELVLHKYLIFAATTQKFARLWDDDEERGATLADVPVDLEKYVTEEFTIHSEDEGAETAKEPKPVDKPQPHEADSWVQRGMFLVHVHRTARTKLFK